MHSWRSNESKLVQIFGNGVIAGVSLCTKYTASEKHIELSGCWIVVLTCSGMSLLCVVALYSGLDCYQVWFNWVNLCIQDPDFPSSRHHVSLKKTDTQEVVQTSGTAPGDRGLLAPCMTSSCPMWFGECAKFPPQSTGDN